MSPRRRRGNNRLIYGLLDVFPAAGGENNRLTYGLLDIFPAAGGENNRLTYGLLDVFPAAGGEKTGSHTVCSMFSPPQAGRISK